MPFILKIIVLAVVQGFTEFFPVSSSGHLLVIQKILNFTTLPLVFDIFFHLGTLLAVLVYFFNLDASAVNPGRHLTGMVYWSCGVAAQVATFAFSVDFRTWRDYAGRFFNP